VPPFGEGELGPHLGHRPTCMSSFIFTDRTGRTDRQLSDSIGKTVLQTIAQKSHRISLSQNNTDMFRTCQHSCCACQQWYCCFCFCVRMDDDSCVIKLIEIVPADNNRNCSESAGVKVSPCHVKICTQYILYYSPILGMVELCFATDFFVFQRQMSETCLRRREIGMDI